MLEETEDCALERERPSKEGMLERRGWGERGTGLGSCRGDEVRGERWICLAGVVDTGEGSGDG